MKQVLLQDHTLDILLRLLVRYIVLWLTCFLNKNYSLSRPVSFMNHCCTKLAVGLDWIVQCFTAPPTQYRLYGRRFLQVKRPNQQYQSTEGSYKGKQPKEQRKHKIHMHRQLASNVIIDLDSVKTSAELQYQGFNNGVCNRVLSLLEALKALRMKIAIQLQQSSL